MRKASMSIESLGKLVLVVLILVAVLIFIISGISNQTSSFNQTSSNIIGNLSGKAESARQGMIIG